MLKRTTRRAVQLRRNAMRHGTSGRQSIVTAIEDAKEFCRPV
jgi:hypothetical protein